MFRFFFYLTCVLFIVSCGGGGSGSDHNPSEKEVTSNPFKKGVFLPEIWSKGQIYEKIQIDNNSIVSVNRFEYNNALGEYSYTDVSKIPGEGFYLELTDEGWVSIEHTERPRYLINGNGIVDNQSSLQKEYNFLGVSNLAGLDVSESLGSGFYPFEGIYFSEGAKKYTYSISLSQDTWQIESRSCGVDCYGFSPVGFDSIDNWMEQYDYNESVNSSDGFYWLGISIFFGLDGAVYLYSYFDNERGLISEDGSWEIVSIKGETILEITIPFSIKKEFRIRAEATPIIFGYYGVLLNGTKYQNSENVPDEYRKTYFFLNEIANEELKSAYTTSLL